MRFRNAELQDVPEIVALLADDPLGQAREGAEPAVYAAAFAAITANPMHQLVVGEEAGRIVACFQLTLLHGLSRRGLTRAVIESVRVASDLRGQGAGAALMVEAETRARAAGAGILQLTSDKTRTRAHEFYRRLGYEATHEGFKKAL